MIVLPALWHGEELQRLLGTVASPDSAAARAPVLAQLAAPWLVALALAAPALVAFCTCFCAMLSPRHILRTFANLQAAEAGQAWALAARPTLAVLVVVASFAWLASGIALEPRVMQRVFFGLAALTLPHMLLLELERGAARTVGR